MKARSVGFVLGLLLPLLIVACSQSPPEDETKHFQGTWQAQDKNKTGTVALVLFDKDTVQITEVSGGNSESTEIGKSERYAFRVDKSEDPAQIELVVLEGEDQGKTRLGIFHLEGDNLKICVADVEQPRPNSFAATDKTTLLILSRKK